jgi:hypothetical protein
MIKARIISENTPPIDISKSSKMFSDIYESSFISPPKGSTIHKLIFLLKMLIKKR